MEENISYLDWLWKLYRHVHDSWYSNLYWRFSLPTSNYWTHASTRVTSLLYSYYYL